MSRPGESKPDVLPLITAMLANEAPLQALVFASPSTIWTGDRDGMLALWSVTERRRLVRLPAHGDWLLALALAPDGKQIASAGADRHVKVWDVATQRLLVDFSGHEGKALAVDFSADGRFVASGAEDKTVRVWDIAERREVAVIRGHSGSVRAVHFARDRALLASSADDGTIRLWHTDVLGERGALLAERVRSRHHVVLAGMRAERDRSASPTVP